MDQGGEEMDARLQVIYGAVLNGDKETAETQVRAAIDAPIPVNNILQDGLIAPMTQVGKLFEAQEFFVPEMLVAARAMQAGLAVLRPLLAESGIGPVGKVVIGTVKGDLHDIGKNLVAMMLEGAGFAVVDIGVDQAPESFVEAAKGAQIVAMSALLTTTMPAMKATIDAFVKAGTRRTVKILVGGAPLTKAFAQEIGADGYAADASSAARLAKEVLSR